MKALHKFIDMACDGIRLLKSSYDSREGYALYRSAGSSIVSTALEFAVSTLEENRINTSLEETDTCRQRLYEACMQRWTHQRLQVFFLLQNQISSLEEEYKHFVMPPTLIRAKLWEALEELIQMHHMEVQRIVAEMGMEVHS